MLNNSPFWVLLKSVLVVVLALAIDKGTRNPDSVTSVFGLFVEFVCFVLNVS